MVHACITLACAPPGTPVRAGRLADFHGLPKAYLTKQLQALVRSGILHSVPGVHGGFSLARPSSEITLMDIVAAVEGRADMFQCTQIRKGGVGATFGTTGTNIPCTVQNEMAKAELAWRKALASRTLADILDEVAKDAPTVLPVTRKWLENA